ncbi:hypothetical protein [Methanosphaera sp.]
MYEKIIYIILAILVLVLIFKLLRRTLKKIGYKDFNKHILQSKNSHENMHFINETTGNTYMIETDTGVLYYCTKINPHQTVNNIKKEHNQFIKSCDPNTFVKISDNYYKIITNDIYFDIEKLSKK